MNQQKVKPKILIIEDDIELNLLFTTILKNENYEVENYHSGNQILSKVDNLNHDLIILDINLPDIDGFEICKILKNNSSSENIPVVFLTSQRDDIYIVKGYELGAEDFIHKPINTTEFLAKIRLHIKNKLLNDKLIMELWEKNQIAEEHRKLTIAVEQSVNTIVITDLDGNIEYANNAFEKTTGYTFNEAIGKNPRILKSGEQPKEFYENLWNVISLGMQWKGEFHNINKFGKSYWEAATITPIKDAEGKVVRYLAIKEDITDKKNAEQIIIQSENKYRKLFENSQLGIAITTINGKVVEANQAVMDMTGYVYEDSLSSNILEIYVNKEERNLFINQILKEGKVNNFETQLYKKNKEIFYANVNSNIFELSGEKLLITTILDITPTKNFETKLLEEKERAETANKLKSRFLANMSHEIRTPLNAVIGFTDILSSVEKEEFKKNYLHSIKSASKTLLHLINDILDLSKIEAGKMQINKSSVDIKTILFEIKEIFTLKSQQKKIDLFFEIPENLPQYVLFDELRIRQILLNLVGNAIKFTQRGYVKIKVEYINNKNNKNDLILRIIDTGIGIKEESQKTIFTAFQQQEDQDARKYEGTGLGLAISKRLIEMMDGKITLKSKIGEGSVFKIKFCNIEETDETINFSDTFNNENSNVKFDEHLILVVDDNDSSRNIVKNYLSDTNLKIIETDDGNKAFILAKQFIPDLIFMDLKMNGIDGFKAAELIKKEPDLKHIPVIAISAISLTEEQQKQISENFNGFIRKPLERNILIDKLVEFFKQTSININDGSIGLLTDINYENVCKVLEELENILHSEWSEIKNSSDISIIENFGTKIMNIGKENKINIIFDYGKKLNLFCGNIDIDNIQLTLSNFREIINMLKSLKSKLENEK